jgi:hypothetical protein
VGPDGTPKKAGPAGRRKGGFTIKLSYVFMYSVITINKAFVDEKKKSFYKKSKPKFSSTTSEPPFITVLQK